MRTTARGNGARRSRPAPTAEATSPTPTACASTTEVPTRPFNPGPRTSRRDDSSGSKAASTRTSHGLRAATTAGDPGAGSHLRLLASVGTADYPVVIVTYRRSPTLALALSAGFAGFAGLGCSATVASGTGDAEVRLSTSAVVVVERMVDPAGGSRAEASARFVRVTSPVSTDEALQAIGAALVLPAAGHCVPLTSLSSASPLSEPAPVVELVDVGSVSLDAEGRETHLVSRLLPDVTDVVSGFVYARTTDPTLLPADSRYTLRVGGRSDLAPIELTASAPADPTNVLTGGTDVDGTLVVTGSSLAFS